jgi:hypothetical protein
MVWLAPMFMSALTPETFLKILYCMMLEKSIVFVSDNLPLLSSAILGLQCFLWPFKWSYVQIPILPRSLVEMVEAPMPFLVGLLRSHLQHVPSISSPRSSHSLDDFSADTERLVVYIHDDKKEVTIDDSRIIGDKNPPSFQGLLERLALPFSVLNYSKYYIYTPNEKQRGALLEIQDTVHAAFLECILATGGLPADVLAGERKFKDTGSLVEGIRAKARPEDRAFLSQFVHTQMLIQHLESNYCAF